MKLNEKFINSFFLLVEIYVKRTITLFRRTFDKYAFWMNANNYCLFCKEYSRVNLPHGTLLTISKSYLKKGVPTKGLRVDAVCPNCGSYDRERFLNYILVNYCTIYSENYNVLHIAPEKNIKDNFEGKNPNYITGDIQFGKANQIVDLTDMKLQFDDNYFDYIICSHVLQDIVNEKDAFNEIKRVLKKDGLLILSIPICFQMSKTLENHNLTFPIERLIYFGNRNHVRMYGNDYLNRLNDFGFTVQLFQVNKILSPDKILQNRFIAEDIVMFCKKY